MTGVIFLAFVRTLLTTQPFFVVGIDDVEDAKSNASIASHAFVASFVASIGIIAWRGCWSRRAVEEGMVHEYSRINADLDYQMSMSVAGSSAPDVAPS